MNDINWKFPNQTNITSVLFIRRYQVTKHYKM